MGTGVDPEIARRRGAGLMPGTCSATATMNVGWSYERPDFVPAPPPKQPPRLEAAPEPEEPPEVEPLIEGDYEPLKLETHESFSDKLKRR